MHSPLTLDGWAEFNQRKWGVRPIKLQIKPGGSSPAIHTVLYLDQRGRIFLPPRNPYLGLEFEPTATVAPYRVSRQWMEVAEDLVEEFRGRGFAGMVYLPPDITDARPFNWAGYRVGVRYTYYIDLPYESEMADHAVRKNLKKASRYGYTVTRTLDMKHVMTCLVDTEARQGFNHSLTVKDLEMAQALLGDEHFRAYVCFAPNGEPASARIVLHQPGGRAIDWVAGTKNEHLPTGATQMAILYALQDLAEVGASGFDYVGANIPNVAAAKANWGGVLKPYYSLDPYNLRRLAGWVRDWWLFAKRAQQGG